MATDLTSQEAPRVLVVKLGASTGERARCSTRLLLRLAGGSHGLGTPARTRHLDDFFRETPGDTRRAHGALGEAEPPCIAFNSLNPEEPLHSLRMFTLQKMISLEMGLGMCWTFQAPPFLEMSCLSGFFGLRPTDSAWFRRQVSYENLSFNSSKSGDIFRSTPPWTHIWTQDPFFRPSDHGGPGARTD